MENNESFKYTYSAKEQQEIQAIRKKYTESEQVEDKMQRLRNLDKSVTKKATVISLVFGIVGVLFLGLGMSLIMTDFNEILGQYKEMSMLFGIVIGVIGIILVALAYPVYNIAVENERKKIAPEIIRLSDELMK